jgi:hypothetical protein
LAVYQQVTSRDDFYLFLQNIYHLYAEQKFHSLIIKTCQRYDDDQAIYKALAKAISEIKTVGSELTYALPGLYKQKREMQSQTSAILPRQIQINGYLEIGSTGHFL